nr:amidohydrolase family protein [uncultured Anaeromusa sp.]
MVVDSHAHVMLPQERQQELMVEAGVDRTILFTSRVHPEKSKTLKELEEELKSLYQLLEGQGDSQETRKQSLIELEEVVKKYPDTYWGFGSIPLGLGDAESLRWIEAQIIARGFCGIGELTPGLGQVALLEPIFQASREAGGLPLWVHAFFPLQAQDIRKLLELAAQYQEVPLIVGHLGGVHWLETLQAVKRMPQVHLDLSAAYTTMALLYAMKELPERVLFASDAPYTSPVVARHSLEMLAPSQQVLELALGENICRLLRK